MDTYEKKYKEALELARVAAFNGHQSLMEGIFPELKESEDEKTRKRIIALVNAHGQGMYKGDMLAWLEKQGEKSLTVDIESMIEAYEQRLINQGNGVRNSPIVNMCVAAFQHGVENTLDELHLKQGEPSIKWNKNTEGNKPQVNHSVLMKTTQGIAEGEWKGEYWEQYRWAGIVRDSDVLSWIELSDLEKQGEQKTDKDMIEALRTEYEKGRADVIADTLSWLENCWPQYCSNHTIIEGFKEAIKD